MQFYAGRASKRGFEHGDCGQDNLPQERTLLNDVVVEGVEISRSRGFANMIEAEADLAGRNAEMVNRLREGLPSTSPTGTTFRCMLALCCI